MAPSASSVEPERQPGGAANRRTGVEAARDLVGDRARHRLLDRAEQQHGEQEHPGPQRADRAVDLRSERARREHVERVREHARRERPDRQQRRVAAVDRLKPESRRCRRRDRTDRLGLAHAAPTAAFSTVASASRSATCQAIVSRSPSSRPTVALKPRMPRGLLGVGDPAPHVLVAAADLLVRQLLRAQRARDSERLLDRGGELDHRDRLVAADVQDLARRPPACRARARSRRPCRSRT